MKIRTWKSNDFNEFKCNCGNGKAVPQLELDKATMLLKFKTDKDGNVVYHNLFNDIQMFKDQNNLERILSLAPNGDISGLSVAFDPNAAPIDYSNVQNVEQIKELQNRLAAQGKTLDDLYAQLNAAIKKQRDLELASLKSNLDKKNSNVNENKEVKDETKK